MQLAGVIDEFGQALTRIMGVANVTGELRSIGLTSLTGELS